jgi:hypothetical protein
VHRLPGVGYGIVDVSRAYLRVPVASRVTQDEDDVPDLWPCSSDESTPPPSPNKPEEARGAPSSRRFRPHATIDDTLIYHDVCLPQFRGRVDALRSLFALSDEVREMARTANGFTTLIYEQSLLISKH